jgi:hypothetical protein|mmetsp:Transcript_44090/g.99669  ORF Transcript_44090/g.99669 Transcript_44090/m.99669 type:complete len:88 (+) Transcript_44090:14-277(+)|eukprot:CAMPEP_0181207854 /NCGR_PEP_ID=MMETSP1096-20121128/21811_1 /TAXON_ID=156174 ORGANISM="Chrysochromulina ericina, Strain CCMP281" /NCGR_SAMPLE_ID=MMETSP1096 /ASSEMBLY_ACC=CAM_ASM_000453 /LENGTH=87 /DNA_ID=CAMNT_0023298889 /DNA_START=11 /DNA_END=274 /DNA_ORIENTATION=-
MADDAKRVEAYLQQFRVEEAVQAAVNSAILHKVRDPILHVAEFLDARGRDHDTAAKREQGVDESVVQGRHDAPIHERPHEASTSSPS